MVETVKDTNTDVLGNSEYKWPLQSRIIMIIIITFIIYFKFKHNVILT